MSRNQRRRVLGFSLLMGLGLLVGAGRLVMLTTVQAAEWSGRAEAQSLRTEVLPAHRGDLRDRHGRLLATSVETLRVEAWPPNLRPDHLGSGEAARRMRAIARFLEPLVEAPVDELLTRMVGDKNAVLGRPVCDPMGLDLLREHRLGLLLPLDLVPGTARRYPWGATAGNLLGFVDATGRGVAGVEQGLGALLEGVDGARKKRVDHRGREVSDASLPELPPLHGLDVALTLDVRLQQIMEHELGLACAEQEARRAFGVLLDSRTAQVLAMASVPGLDPDDGSDRPADGAVIGAVQEIYPPGSTFKPLMMATALALGLVGTDEVIDCRIERGLLPGRRVQDTFAQDRWLTLEEILVHSSNIGMASLFWRLLPPETPKDTEAMAPVRSMLERLGFGDPVGLPLPAEASGMITPLSRWHRTWTLTSVSYGQEISVTALQMAAAVNALTDGVWRRPSLVAGHWSEDGDWLPAEEPDERPVFAPRHAELVRGWMARSVEEGKVREVQFPGVAVAGKTGTADSEVDLSREIHSYAALAPADDPVVTLVVVVSEPQHARFSSQSAGPPAGRILAQALPYLGHPIQ